eukprot:TRINITY_DN25018_c0_g1_i2.p1 TRINITY_DN25018_c0_g1~~TRINITY_DN25018_c0_g1_i2.p1  ORF type:complete len:191 (+),score=27.28 TRINITY_DN25018_c0_g1_i2:22-573(+)
MKVAMYLAMLATAASCANVTVLLDASQSMHPNGYNALLDQMQEWEKGLNGGVKVRYLQCSTVVREAPNGTRDVLQWHKENFIGKGSLIKECLSRAVSTRPGFLVITMDTPPHDDPVVPTPSQAGVPTFGVVLRRTAIHTKMDIAVEATLEDLEVVSEPVEEFIYNTMIDGVGEVMNEISAKFA